jgi:peptidoglycan/xylan/chitin deacetylase (PgdA/CDA1 family)
MRLAPFSLVQRRRRIILLDIAAFTAVCAIAAGAVVWADATAPGASRRTPGHAHPVAAVPVYCGGTGKPMIALTFDDGPGRYTARVVRRLAAHRARATFFVLGTQLVDYSGDLRREARVGAIGDHTVTHPLLPPLESREIALEVSGGQMLAAHDAGAPVTVFRPPYGASNAAIDAEAASLGMAVVMWSVDSRDSEGAGAAQIARNVAAGLTPGAIVLLHDRRAQTARALTTILASIRRRNLKTVTVPQLLAADPPSAAQLRAGLRGCVVSGTISPAAG